MLERTYYDNLTSSEQITYRLSILAQSIKLKKDDFLIIASMQPPPATVASVAHITMLYNGLHSKNGKDCHNGCFRDFQKWLKQYVRGVGFGNQVEFGREILRRVFTMDVGEDVLRDVGKLVRADPYMNEQSLRNQSNATYALLVTIMGRVKMMELEAEENK